MYRRISLLAAMARELHFIFLLPILCLIYLHGGWLLEEDARMDNVEDDSRDGAHIRIHNDKPGLLSHYWISPTSTEFCYAVATTCEDAQESYGYGYEEQPKFDATSQSHAITAQNSMIANALEEKLHTQCKEYDQCEDLEGQTSNHDVHARIEETLRLCNR